jgi:hypothetical protein
MKRRNTAKLVGAGLLALALSGLGLREVSAEPDRRLQSALRHLQDAREDLRNVRRDPGGHGEQALDFTVRAMRQVEEAIRLERPHEHRERR